MAKLPIPQEITEQTSEEILKSLVSALDTSLNQTYEALAKNEQTKQIDKDPSVKP